MNQVVLLQLCDTRRPRCVAIFPELKLPYSIKNTVIRSFGHLSGERVPLGLTR